MRIAFGGIAHETNTFSTLRTDLPDFTVLRGEQIAEAGYVAPGAETVPTLVATASPGALVARRAYEGLRDELLARLEQALPVDGMYLRLHGAMEVGGIGNGERDLVRSVRKVLGPEVPMSAYLDLHGNLAPELAEHVNVLTALRTAPHVDGESVFTRAVSHLLRSVREGLRPVSALVKVPLLLPGEFAVTSTEPARSLYRRLEEIEAQAGLLDASLLVGCAWTDGPDTGASVIVVAEEDRALARVEAARLAEQVWERRAEFAPHTECLPAEEAVAVALAAREPTVFVSDSGDNVTAGAPGDLTRLAALLTTMRARGLIAGLADAEAVAECTKVGPGATLSLSVGGKLDGLYGSPLAVTGRVVHLTPGLAALRVGEVDLVLTADRRPFLTLHDFATAGVNPFDYRVVVVKQGYLSAELRDCAPRAIIALTPGCSDLRVERLPYARLSRPIFPLDGQFDWSPPI